MSFDSRGRKFCSICGGRRNCMGSNMSFMYEEVDFAKYKNNRDGSVFLYLKRDNKWEVVKWHSFTAIARERFGGFKVYYQRSSRHRKKSFGQMIIKNLVRYVRS